MTHSNTVGSAIYQKIKDDIIYGKLQPSTKLKLDKLSNSYSVSMSTLRECLNRLSSEGFVSAEEQRGFFVTSISLNDFEEITNLRILLECHALKLSLKNGDTEWEGNLVGAYHKLHTKEKEMQNGDVSTKKSLIRYDWGFHQSLILACNSANLISLHSLLYYKFLRYQMLLSSSRGGEAVNEHKKIFDSALERDFPKAEKELKNHVKMGLNFISKGYEFN